MNRIEYILIVSLILSSKLFSQCDNNSLADYNDDNLIDVLDLVVLVDEIMNENQNIENSDINLDGVVDILDVV